MNNYSEEADLRQAISYHQLGQLNQAEAIYRKILANKPQHTDVLHLLGLVNYQSGKPEIAINFIKKAISLSPESPDFFCNLGDIFRSLERFDEAIQAYQKAILIGPKSAKIYNTIGIVFNDNGQIAKAIRAYQKAIIIDPKHPQAYNNMGAAFAGLGQFNEAINFCKQAIELDSHNYEAYNNLGNIYNELGQPEDALQAFQRALAINPKVAEIHYNFADALKFRGRLEEAIIAYHKAIVINPSYSEAYNSLGIILKKQGKLGDAVAAYKKAIALDSNCSEAYNNLGIVLKEQDRLEEAITAYNKAIAVNPNFVEAHTNLIFTQDFHLDIGLKKQQAERQKWNQRFILPLANSIQLCANDRNPDRRLRIGYVSADFKQHSAAQGFGQLILNYNRTQFAIFCYSGVAKEDEVTMRFKDSASGWYSTVGKSDKELVEQIRNDEIDILVDLSGHTGGNRLLTFGYKPAPIQVTGIGHDAPGVTTIDYRLTTPVRTRPEEERHFVEVPVYLDFFIGFTISSKMPTVGYLPVYENGYVTFGCLNRFSKVSGESLELWASLLRRIPSSKLLLKSGEFDDIELRERTIERLIDLAVSPDRVILLGRTSQYEHLNTYNQVDISLDPFPYGGGATTLESLFMGVPVVSLTSDSKITHRNSHAILSPLGLNEWVAKTKDEYVEIVCRWANNLENLARLRKQSRGQMEERMSEFVPQVEIAYKEMWRRWCGNEKPSSIYR